MTWQKDVVARSEAEPRWTGEGNLLPMCSESCPQHDGKRCRLMGFRPDRLCEPAVFCMADLLEERHAELG